MSVEMDSAAEDPERSGRLGEARALLIAALELLDLHSRSPAPATVDFAIHQINSELLKN